MDKLRAMDVKAAEIMGFGIIELLEPYGYRVDYQAYDVSKGDKNSLYNKANYQMINSGMVEAHKLKHFSRNIQDAFTLIEFLESKGLAVIMQNDTHESNKVWYVRNWDLDTLSGISMMSRGWKPHEEIETEAPTLPEAITMFLIKARELGYL